MAPYLPISARNSSIGLISAARSLDWALIARGSSPLRAKVLSRMSTGTAKMANNDNGVKDISKSTTTPDSSDDLMVAVVVVDVDGTMDVATSRTVNSIRQSDAIPVTPPDDTTSNTG